MTSFPPEDSAANHSDVLISFVVVSYNMQREIPRTLFSLTTEYQRHCEGIEYEVLVVDNGSSAPLDAGLVESFGPQFRYFYYETDSPSPAAAINWAADKTRGRFISICVDGARILSPGMLRTMRLAASLCDVPVISSLAWHLGPKVQSEAMLEGYDRTVEDRMLAESRWEEDGYRLFDISCFAASSREGWFRPISECNTVCIPRTLFEAVGGFDARFQSKGGGYVNLDFYKRVCEFPGTTLVTLLGEGSFHQIHGGASTNARPAAAIHAVMADEYLAVRGETFVPPQRESLFLGSLPRQAIPFLIDSAASLGESRPRKTLRRVRNRLKLTLARLHDRVVRAAD